MSEKQHFHDIKVKAVNHETPDTVTISFDVDQEHKDLFRYIHGQYLTIRLRLSGEEYRRSYSICTAPYESELKVAVKKVEDGVVSSYLNEQLKAGDILEVMPPMGNFYIPFEADNQKSYVAFAAGSGITPVISLIKAALHTEPRSKFRLIYGNREVQHIIFKRELDQLQEVHNGRFTVSYVLSREAASSPLFEGRIDRHKVEAMAAQEKNLLEADDYFLCGPWEMISNISDFLTGKGVSENHIHYELFTAPAGEEEEPLTEGSDDEGIASGFPVSKVNILLDGEETTLELDKSGPAILDAAIAAGIDPPYSCKGAVCTTCMARLQKGKVKMDMNHALTDGELNEGLILTCQSHPVTDEVSISYDDI